MGLQRVKKSTCRNSLGAQTKSIYTWIQEVLCSNLSRVGGCSDRWRFWSTSVSSGDCRCGTLWTWQPLLKSLHTFHAHLPVSFVNIHNFWSCYKLNIQKVVEQLGWRILVYLTMPSHNTTRMGGCGKKGVSNIRAFLYRDWGVARKASVGMATSWPKIEARISRTLYTSANYGGAAVFGDKELMGSWLFNVLCN
jgi:hypothetical protein